MSDLGTPWEPRSRQDQGRRSEADLARQRGTRPHPGSGSGSIRQDASNEDVIEEYKLVARTFRLNGRTLRDSYLAALAQDKDSVWVIRFDDVGIEVELRMRFL